jgi:putative oxidoreductase
MVVAPLSRGTIAMTDSAIAAQRHSQNPSADAGLTGVLPLAGRILIAAIFLISGVMKLAAPAGTIGYIQAVGLPLPELGLAIAVVVEIGGGLALILGYRTRAVAAALAVFTLATAVFFHFHLADQNQFIHFFKNLAITGGLLQIVAFGAPRLSLDARRG